MAEKAFFTLSVGESSQFTLFLNHIRTEYSCRVHTHVDQRMSVTFNLISMTKHCVKSQCIHE